jgi:hypothetical protein
MMRQQPKATHSGIIGWQSRWQKSVRLSLRGLVDALRGHGSTAVDGIPRHVLGCDVTCEIFLPSWPRSPPRPFFVPRPSKAFLKGKAH